MKTDKYGNDIDGDKIIYCCFPDCGCDGARLCMAENGASELSFETNVENMWNATDRKSIIARNNLVGIVATEKEQLR